MEIAFVVVTPPDNSVEIYIDASVENPSLYLNEVKEFHVGGTSYKQATAKTNSLGKTLRVIMTRARPPASFLKPSTRRMKRVTVKGTMRRRSWTTPRSI